MIAPIAKGGLQLSLGQGVTLVLSFLRNMILAKLLGPENMGVGAGFMSVMVAVELTSDLGMQKLVVQSNETDNPRFIGTVHSMVLIRSFLLATIIFLVAGPSARWFQAPEAVWAFQLLALVPLCKSLTNLDIYRQHRDLKFHATISVDILSQAAAFMIAVAVGLAYGTYSAILAGVLSQSMTSAMTSQLFASKRHLFAMERTTITKIYSFGWPLAISGVLMLIGIQSDRFIVGRAFGLNDLGNYSLALTLAMAPFGAIAKVFNSMYLPLLARSRDEPGRFLHQFRRICVLTSLAAAGCACLFMLLGRPTVMILFGDEYRTTSVLMGWMGIIVATRLLRIVPNQAALALGDTKVVLCGNIARAGGTLFMISTVLAGCSLQYFVTVIFLCESIALLAQLLALRSFSKIPLSAVSTAILIPVVAVLLTGCLNALLPPDELSVTRIVFALLATIGLALAFARSALGTVRWRSLFTKLREC